MNKMGKILCKFLLNFSLPLRDFDHLPIIPTGIIFLLFLFLLSSYYSYSDHLPFRSTIDHLPIIPTGETPSFVKESDTISPWWLYQNFNYGDLRGLVSMHFLAPLNIYFGGNTALCKDVMSEIFHNLSIKALSISDDSNLLKLNALKKFNKNIT